jgi:hypothetical protein
MSDGEDNAAQPYRTKLSVLFAARRQKAIILRRGPKTHWRLIEWDLASDTFTPGQWMKGLVRLCDLSPNGDKLLYWAAQHHAALRFQDRTDGAARTYDPLNATSVPLRRRGHKIPAYMRTSEGSRPNTGTWTAISNPPYFSALAIWPSFGHWTGGGVFLSEREILLREDQITPKENVTWPEGMKIRSAFEDKSKPWWQTPPSAYSPLREGNDEVARALQRNGLKWFDWVTRRSGADMLFAGDGRLWRCKEWEGLRADQYLAKAQLIADFSDMQFEPIAAPNSAVRW